VSYQFFLSYSRCDEDKYLLDFFEDLKEEVRLLTPGRKNVCFWDKESIQIGEEWPQKLFHALQTCKVFVALCTPTYFTREWCGKEWQFFSDRINDYQQGLQEKSSNPSLIIPIKWIHRSDTVVPTCVSKYQNINKNLGDIYDEEGLRFLIKLHKNKYTECLHIFAKIIIEAIEQYPLSDSKKNCALEDVKNAFEESSKNDCRKISKINTGGPNFVKFFYVVGYRNELSRVKKNVDSYGDSGAIDWKPYYLNIARNITSLS